MLFDYLPISYRSICSLIASKVCEVAVLLKVNARSRSRKTPLHVAAAQGHPELVLHLLGANADVLAQTEGQNIALHYAAANGHAQVVKQLLEQDGKQLSMRNLLGQRPAEAAATEATAFLFRAHLMAGSRRSSACSDASTVASSGFASAAGEVEVKEEDGSLEANEM